MERRSALKLIAIGALAEPLAAQHAGHAAAGAAAASEAVAPLKFFTPAQNEWVDRLAEMILPADEHSPGAHEAKVSAFIDQTLADGNKGEQDLWIAGLKAVEAEAQTRFQKAFLKCSPAEQDQMLAAMAANEAKPQTEIERFFVKLKAQTISGYYTSPVGLLKDLQYKGNVPLAEYAACDHAEHKT